jgi:hypothetical protein
VKVGIWVGYNGLKDKDLIVSNRVKKDVCLGIKSIMALITVIDFFEDIEDSEYLR